MNKVKNQNHKLARAASSEDVTHFVVNDNAAKTLLQDEVVKEYNEKVEEYTEKLDRYSNELEKYATQFNEQINDMEIKAIGDNLIVFPYSQNPFQHIKTTESGIILNTGGMAPEYKSNESGEYEEEEQYIHVGIVVDAGPMCKYIKEGDVIMWEKPFELPIPFYRQNLYKLNESRTLCVINSGLTERFNNLKK